MTNNFSKLCCALSISIAIGSSTPAIAQDTVLPDFKGKQSRFANYRAKITNAMLESPNFFEHYSLITIGCGTSCKFGFLGNHRTGDLFSFPFGGEEHSDIQLEFSIDSNEIVVSFQDNSLIETDQGWKPLYPSGDSPCTAVRLAFQDEGFLVIERRSSNRFNRYCPSGSDLLTVNSLGLSAFEEDCLSELTRFDLCEYAKKVASEFENNFPLQIDNEISVRSLRNEGARLVSTALWDLTQAETNRRLNLNNMSSVQMRQALERSGVKNACDNEVLSAFLRLGGTLSYRYLDSGYRTLHEFDVQSENCGQAL